MRKEKKMRGVIHIPWRIDIPPQKVYIIFRCGNQTIKIRTTWGGRGAEVEVMHPREVAVVETSSDPADTLASTKVKTGDAK